MLNFSRDLLEDRDGEYPAHMTIREFQCDGTDLTGSLWLGSENSESEVDVALTDEDLDWMINALQQVRDRPR